MIAFICRFALRDLYNQASSLRIFLACLILGVMLIAATGSLYHQVSAQLLSDTRALLGGDVQLDSNRTPLPEATLQWLQQRADVSLLIELDTLLESAQGEFVRAELLVQGEGYPLYGTLSLAPEISLASATQSTAGVYGVAIDPLLAQRLGKQVGDRLEIGRIQAEIRALITAQPDRRLNAGFSGPPLMLSDAALQASGLAGFGSRQDHEYRLRLYPEHQNIDAFTRSLRAAFPEGAFEIRTFESRSDVISERLGQVATALILVGLTTLLIGGLGVANSVEAYLRDKMPGMATLQALGLRQAHLCAIYLLQITVLALVAACVGAGAGLALAASALLLTQADFPLQLADLSLWPALALSIVFSLFTAALFSIPALGRAVSIRPAGLFRGELLPLQALPRGWQLATGLIALSFLLLLFMLLPSPVFLAVFLAAAGLLWCLFLGFTQLLRRLSQRLTGKPRRLSMALALANLQRPDSPTQSTLLSLGTALTLIISAALLVLAVARSLEQTVSQEMPALVFYDLLSEQQSLAEALAAQAAPAAKMEILPLVPARLESINGTPLAQWPGIDPKEREDSLGDTFKLSYFADNPDQTLRIAGKAFNPSEESLPQLSLEDREARQLGVGLGDELTFVAETQQLTFVVHALHSQQGLQTRFWFEGLSQEGALDGVVNRHVGLVYGSDSEARLIQQSFARELPQVLSARTNDLVTAARSLLNKAAVGLASVTGLSLLVSLLVLAGIASLSRRRQSYESGVLLCLGARATHIERAWIFESIVLYGLTSVIACVLALLLTIPLSITVLKLDASSLWWMGSGVAFGVTLLTLIGGLVPSLRRLKMSPCQLLRE